MTPDTTAPTSPLSNNRSSLCSVLLWMASDTFCWLQSGYKNPPAPNEESFTDLNIRHLRDFLDRRVKVFQYDKYQERVEGADWEMWIHNGSRGIGLRIQAKKADKAGRYPFSHEVKSQRAYQCDQLIQRAADVHCVPIYLLYNYWAWRGGAQENAAQAGLLCGHVAKDGSHHGCTLVSAHDVQAELYGRQLGLNIRHKRLWQSSLPWNRVLCDERLPQARRDNEAVLRDIFGVVQHLDASGKESVSAAAGHVYAQQAAVPVQKSTTARITSPREGDAVGSNSRLSGSRRRTPSHMRWGDRAFAQVPYEDPYQEAEAVLNDGPQELPDHVRILLEAHEMEPPPPPVPTRCTLLYDVSREAEESPTDVFGCVRP